MEKLQGNIEIFSALSRGRNHDIYRQVHQEVFPESAFVSGTLIESLEAGIESYERTLTDTTIKDYRTLAVMDVPVAYNLPEGFPEAIKLFQKHLGEQLVLAAHVDMEWSYTRRRELDLSPYAVRSPKGDFAEEGIDLNGPKKAISRLEEEFPMVHIIQSTAQTVEEVLMTEIEKLKRRVLQAMN